MSDALPELLVASRGDGPEHGLVGCTRTAHGWRQRTLGTADQLSALAWHPTLPVVYGTAGVRRVGQVLAWRLTDDGAEPVADEVAGEDEYEPCHLAVDPTGRVLAVTNYTSGELALWRLDGAGGLLGDPLRMPLTGSGPETDRQDAAHPHQAVFHPGTGRLLVVDLGADLVRELELEIGSTRVDAREVRAAPVPPGTGPRHLVVLPDGRVALSGELGSTLVVGHLDRADWRVAGSTRRTGPARTRHERNYPGDIQASPGGEYVYVANRGYDTIAVFDVRGEEPVLVVERDAVVRWPQHLLVRAHDLLVAGWDSSQIVSLPLTDGVPGEAVEHLVIDSPGWLLAPRPALG